MEGTRVEILGISELKWTEMGHFQSDEYKVFFCGQDHVRRNSVAIICDKDTSRCVIGYKPMSDRIISIRLDGHLVSHSHSMTMTMTMDIQSQPQLFK